MRRSTLFALLFGVGAAAWWLTSRAASSFEPEAPPWTPDVSTAVMSMSPQGVQALKDREGFSPVSYPDASGRSIGYGHFIQPGESFAEPMDELTASDLLFTDLAPREKAVRDYVVVALTQNQFDALVSLAYNIGVENFKRSTLLALLNQGDYRGAADQFARWNKSQGEVLKALIARRAAEFDQFMMG